MKEHFYRLNAVAEHMAGCLYLYRTGMDGKPRKEEHYRERYVYTVTNLWKSVLTKDDAGHTVRAYR